MKPPWWFCCGWCSPWRVADVALHELGIPVEWVCARHDQAIFRMHEKGV